MGTLTFQNGKFIFDARTREARRHAIEAHLQYDAQALRWVTRNAAKAVALRRFADPVAEQKLKNTFITETKAPESILYPDGLFPKSWQIMSAWHALTRTPAYIADEAGMGKTITASLCFNSIPGNTLVVCPAFLKYNWEAELRLWCEFPKVRPTISHVTSDGFIDADILIVSDAMIINHHVQECLKARQFEWLFIDEFHRFKEENAQRSNALLGTEEIHGVTSLAKRVVLLSGTPNPNGRPIELYSSLSRIAPFAIGHRTLEEFGKTFCAGKKVTRFEGKRAIAHWDFKGASNLEKLGSELFESFMIRHEKKDHLKELGPKTRRLVFLDQPKRFQKFEANLLKAHSLEDLLGADHDLGDIASYRKEIGVAKIIPAFNYIREILENNESEKLVVFAHHIQVVEELSSLLSKFGALKIRGGMTAKEKSDTVKRFQTDPLSQVIVGNIDSMGVGVTLTSANRMVMAEYSFVPGVNEQAEDRIHRITQTGSTHFDYLVYRESLDERMLRSSMSKQTNINRIMKGKKNERSQ